MLNWKKNTSFEAESFDMTPIIDVVFLLIIFFMLVCQFIAAEQFKVTVPDDIASAQQQQTEKKPPLTITVMKTEQGAIECAIGSERVADMQDADLADRVTFTVNDYLISQKPADKTIRLRCDKSIAFGHVKYILAGIAESNAENLDWAVLPGN